MLVTSFLIVIPVDASDTPSWHTMFSGTSEDLWDVHSISPTEVFAVGDDSTVAEYEYSTNCTVLKYNGAEWIHMDPGINCQLRGIWGSSGHDIFAVGKKSRWVIDNDGIIIHFDGTSWASEAIGIVNNLFDIWGTSSSNIYAVGENGTILHYDSITWTQIENINPAIHFRAIWGSSSSDIYAVGASYTPGVTNMLHYDGISWEPVDSGTTQTLLGIWGSSSSDVYAVGAQDTILHYDGTSWQSLDIGMNTNFSDVWGNSPSDVFVVGQNGIIYFDGSTWNPIPGSSSYVLYGVGGTETEVFCVGMYGKIAYFGTKELPAIWAEPVREWFDRDSVTDFDAAVGESVRHYAFRLWCDPLVTDSTDITVTNENSAFSIYIVPPFLQGGTWSYATFEFSPTQSGIVTDNVTVTSDVGNISFGLVGNGVLIEYPEFQIIDLPPGTKAERLLYDVGRDYLYITDSNNNCVIVLSTQQQNIVVTIPVGYAPIDLAMTPDGERLYVTNSGEPTISEIDLGTLTELRRFVLPSLGHLPGFMPYSIAMISNEMALIGSNPPGIASGGPIYQLDVNSLVLTARDDIGSGIRPVLRTSADFSTTIILLEPESSPTKIVRYDNATGSFISSAYNNIERDVAINDDGTSMIATAYDSNIYRSDLRLFDYDLLNIKRINLLSYKVFMPVYHPSGDYFYTADDPTYSIQEADLNTMSQVRDLRSSLPPGYFTGIQPKGIAISDGGVWLYALLVQTHNEPPSKLLRIKIDRAIEWVPGDANENGEINVLDITKVARIILGWDSVTPGADVNQDGVVNVLDMTEIAKIILG